MTIRYETRAFDDGDVVWDVIDDVQVAGPYTTIFDAEQEMNRDNWADIRNRRD